MPATQIQQTWFAIECAQAADVLEVALFDHPGESIYRAPSGAAETVLLAAGVLRFASDGQDVASSLWYELTLEPEQPHTPNTRLIRCMFAGVEDHSQSLLVGLTLGKREHVISLTKPNQIAEWHLPRSEICDPINPRRVRKPISLKLYKLV